MSRRGMAGDGGSTSTMGLLGALALFAIGFTTMQPLVAPAAPSGMGDSSLQSEAERLLGTITRSPGAARSGAAWQDDPDNLTSFGIAARWGEGRLDAGKVAALLDGVGVRAADGRVGYEEARGALDADAGFRLSVRPILAARADPGWSPLALRVAYFAHYTGAAAPVAATTAVVGEGSAINVSVTITNRAAAPAIFTASFELGDPTRNAALISQQRHTTLLDPGASQTLWVRHPGLPSWDPSIRAVRVAVSDPYGNAAVTATGTPLGAPWISLPAMPVAAGNPYALMVQAASPYYVSGSAVNFRIDHHDGWGDHVRQASARLVVTNPAGVQVVNQTVALPHQPNSAFTFSCGNCTTPGDYVATVRDDARGHQQMDRVRVTPAKMFTEKTTIAPAALAESRMLEGLLRSFNATRHDALHNPGGDVFGDDVNGPTALATLLSRYDVVVVGSDVAEHALSPADVKYAVASWLEDGGSLLLLGQRSGPSRWLEPVYGWSLDATAAPPVVVAPDDPILSLPEALDVARYVSHGRGWLSKGEALHSVVAAGDASLLASGEVGAGRVVATAYVPGALTNPPEEAEGQRLLHNLLVRSALPLFVEMGPPVPEGVPVAAARRILLMNDGTPGSAGLPTLVTLHVWR